jgi:hypothetical protein
MGDFVYNIAKGRVAELYNRVDQNDPANAVLVIAVLNTSETDTNLKRLDTLSAVTGNANTAEVTNTGYARKVLTDSDIVAFAPDDVNDYVELDIPDQTWTGVAAGDSWTDFQVNYDSDSTAGTDANIVPCTQHDFSTTPDGSDITAQINVNGFFRAT